MKKVALSLACIIVFGIVVGFTIAQRRSSNNEADASAEQWEYLVVSAANNVNFSSPSTGTMRKEAAGFQREAFVLEQNMDKLGLKGWELVSVNNAGPEPIFYFKRKK